MMTKKSKLKKAAPVEAQLRELMARVDMLEQVKDEKTPFYEKLPKDSAFYKHYISLLQSSRMQESANGNVIENREVFKTMLEANK